VASLLCLQLHNALIVTSKSNIKSLQSFSYVSTEISGNGGIHFVKFCKKLYIGNGRFSIHDTNSKKYLPSFTCKYQFPCYDVNMFANDNKTSI
jgi:hypothetical protein